MTNVAYHGTRAESVENILAVGILPTPLLPPYIMEGHVYLTPDINVAKRFGEVVFKVDLSKLDASLLGEYREMLCDILETDPFINYKGAVPPEALTLLTDTDHD